MYYRPLTNKVVELHSDIRKMFPNVSFSENLTDEDLAVFGVYPLVVSRPAFDPFTQKLVFGTPQQVDNRWVMSASIIDLTPEEKVAYRKAQVPGVVFMRQARLALHRAGLLTKVPEIIESLEEPLRTEVSIEWEYSSEVRRDWPALVKLLPALGLNEKQVDDLFIEASKL